MNYWIDSVGKQRKITASTQHGIPEYIEKRCVFSPTQRVELKPMHKKSLRFLDIGGGGEGIIGKLYGANVVAIDTRADELYETSNDALKIEMDAGRCKAGGAEREPAGA